MPFRKALAGRLTPDLRESLFALSRREAAELTEIRVRVGCPVCWISAGGSRSGGPSVTRAQMEELVSALCERSRYAYEAQIAQGFIALPGGHRAGICGRVTMEEGRAACMSAIRSVCIRIARAVPGASRPIRSHLLLEGRPARVLLLGPPGIGKTTVLRDAALFLAGECGWQTAVADEREELFPGAEALPLDVVSGANKAEGMRLLIRSMAPQVIITDEIGRPEDAQALLDAASCGVGVLASAHASSMADAIRRPVLRELIERRAFDRYILLGALGRCAGVFDDRCEAVMEEKHGESGSGGDGAGRNQRDRLFAGGRGAAAPDVDPGNAPLPPLPRQSHPL